MWTLALTFTFLLPFVAAVEPKPICSGPLPTTGWPKATGIVPWFEYLSLQELCGGIRTADRGFASKSAPYSLDCNCPAYQLSTTFLLCEIPTAWKPEGWDLVDYCNRRCRYPGDTRPLPPNPPPVQLSRPLRIRPLLLRNPKRRRTRPQEHRPPQDEAVCIPVANKDLEAMLFCEEALFP
jgi:hypothetical protein